MMMGSSDSEWVMKLGPVGRVNQAKSKEQAEECARQKVTDVVKVIMEKAQLLIPLLKEGAQCPGGA